MTKKHDIVFNLTIDDLKELGIIKKRRRRRQKRITYINGIPSNIKSSSDHMTGYSNVFNNTSNLQQENIKLQNSLIEQKLLTNDYENENDNENRFLALENDTFRIKRLARLALKQGYDGAYNRPAYDRATVEQLNDNIDVAATGGSDNFKSTNNNMTSQPEIDEPNVNSTPIQQQPNLNTTTPSQTMTGIRTPSRTPSKALYNILSFGKKSKVQPITEDNKIRQDDVPNYSATKVSQDDVRLEDIYDTKSSIDANEILDTESGTPLNEKRQQYESYRFTEGKSKATTTPQPHESALKPRAVNFSDSKSIAPSFAVDYSSLKPPPPPDDIVEPPQSKQPSQYRLRQGTIAALKSEYTNLGGEDEDVHTSTSMKFIRASIERQKQINEEKSKTKTISKKGRKKSL